MEGCERLEIPLFLFYERLDRAVRLYSILCPQITEVPDDNPAVLTTHSDYLLILVICGNQL